MQRKASGGRYPALDGWRMAGLGKLGSWLLIIDVVSSCRRRPTDPDTEYLPHPPAATSNLRLCPTMTFDCESLSDIMGEDVGFGARLI